ncbi:hypothetical protein VUR80DRAFT_5716 [Thermomyces stellatus]
MPSDNNPSTLSSYANSAAGTVQSGIASLTGNTSKKVDAQQAKAKADTQHEASHSATKIGPFSVGGGGGVAQDNQQRREGRYDQTMGSVKEATGNLLGNQQMVNEGRRQNESGQGQEAKGQLKDLKEGAASRVQGALGGAVAGLTGDRAEQQRQADKHDEGKARQRGVEAEVNQQATEE